ncbi:MAG: DEAD/DEAH box helicase family protein [Chitinispirillaceae bacterium]|nr:DEAD/DEAH box helicase family protein [Chitinispirillaceae bacterium]
MSQTIIENPIINSAFEAPTRHFKFSDEGITDETLNDRRPSSYFVPIAKPKKKNPLQLSFDNEWTKDRIEENKLVNQIRDRIKPWRRGGYSGITPTTARLLAYWNDPQREKKLFFCQIEALETAIYITEVGRKFGDAWIENAIRAANDSSNPGLPRLSFKMATGSGKTVVMAMVIAWHTLNKLANPQDSRFSDTFLIITPGITIRDRLRVLLPNDPQNYYRQRDIIPAQSLVQLCQSKIIITNYHALQLREKVAAGKITKQILADGGPAGAFTETPEQMVRRVCRELGNKKNIIVINDEAHHCYRRKPDSDDEQLKGDDRKEALKREEEARVWINGIEAVKSKIGVKSIYDLSATPFFLRGSGYPEGTLFPWVVSDFSLIEAIESGIVKVPRVPVSDDSMTGDQPTYRDLWLRISDGLPKKSRRTDSVSGEPKLPAELQGALHSLYSNYEKYYQVWENNSEARAKGITPPVFIVVCNNTNVSKLVYDYVAGWEKPINEKFIVQAGQLPIFRNDDGNGNWLHRPNTILVDSEQLESGEAMSDDFKKIASHEVEEFKAEYRIRFPGRDAENLTDEDLLREVMNTVGKAGKLGEHVKCVISVSMLTEGWDANTVTHILGIRAFGTQLLCEQVVGRALRRMSYATGENGFFSPEYAEVYGVPFSFIPCSGSTADPKPGALPTRVRALENRKNAEIVFPRLIGYRYDLLSEHLSAKFTKESKLVLSTADIPTKTENAPIVGETSIHTLDDLKRRRPNEVSFLLAKLTLEKYFRSDDGADKPWLFPQLLTIAKHWLAECVTLKDNTFLQLLLLIEFAHDAADRIYKAIVQSAGNTPSLKPILRPYDTLGSTRYVDFDTTRPVYSTREDKCHISHVVADTDSWEQKLAQTLEDMPEVIRYAKTNKSLGFYIPYTINGEEKNYEPDFIVCINDEKGIGDPLQLIIEVTGENRKDKIAKVSTATTLWVPAVNNHNGFGRWDFIEISDPWDAAKQIRKHISEKAT